MNSALDCSTKWPVLLKHLTKYFNVKIITPYKTFEIYDIKSTARGRILDTNFFIKNVIQKLKLKLRDIFQYKIISETTIH